MATKKGNESRERIITTALALFKARGYHQTKIADICEAADMATGTYYHHFKSKQDVLTGYIAQANEDIWNYYQGLHEGSHSETILKLVAYKVAFYTRSGPEMVSDLFSVVILKEIPFDIYEYAFTRATEDAYRKGQAAGEFNPEISPSQFADMAACLFFYTVILWSTQKDFPPLLETMQAKFINMLNLHQARK